MLANFFFLPLEMLPKRDKKVAFKIRNFPLEYGNTSDKLSLLSIYGLN